eukprot:2084970-Pleurochrysis_carterae.AAC.1
MIDNHPDHGGGQQHDLILDSVTVHPPARALFYRSVCSHCRLATMLDVLRQSILHRRRRARRRPAACSRPRQHHGATERAAPAPA